VILKFEPKHTEAIVDIFYKASLLVHPFLNHDFLEQEKINIREIYLPNVKTWVFENEGIVIGFVSLLKNDVMAIFVDLQHHSLGYAKAMMDHAVDEAGDLEVVVFEENSIGRQFYERCGFKFMSKYIHEPTQQMCHRLSYQLAEL
jgi:putative acetyltransferase